MRHWGVTKLGEYEYKQSIDEMKHAEELIERILFSMACRICKISTSC